MLTVGEFKNGYALITNPLYCLIDTSGKTVLGDSSYFLSGGSEYNSQFEVIPAYCYADEAMQTKKYGFVDINGNPKIPFIFEYVSNICGDLSYIIYEEDGEVKPGIISLRQ